MVKTGHSKRKLFSSAKEQKENTTPQDHTKQLSYISGGSSTHPPDQQPHHHHPHLNEGDDTTVPLRYRPSKAGSAAAAGERPLPNIAGTAVASPGPGKHASSDNASHLRDDGRGGLSCSAVSASPRPHTMPMSERQQIALLLQMSSPSPPNKGISNGHNSHSSVSSRCNSPYSPHCSSGGQEYSSNSPLYSSATHLTHPHYSGMVTGSGGRGGGVAKRNERGETPLHVAAIRGDADRVHHLIARGSDVNAVDYAGWTALHEACNRGFVSVAQELISAGACVNAKGLDNETPLHDACVNNHFKIVELLLENGASTSVLNRRGQTPGEVCRSPGILSLLRRANQNSDSSCDDRGSESLSKMSRRTPPNNKLDSAKMEMKQSDNIKTEKDIKTEDPDEGSMASSSGSGSSLPPAGGCSSGGTQGATAASGPSPGTGGTAGTSSSSPGSPRITLRLPPSTARTPEKAGRSTSDNKGSEAGCDDPYEFKCSKDEPGHGTAGGTATGGGGDTPSKGGDGAVGEERVDKRPVPDEDDEGEQAKKKKRKEDATKETGTGGGVTQGGKGANRGGEKSSKPAARAGPLHSAVNSTFSAGVNKTGAGSGTNSTSNTSGFLGGQSSTPASSVNSSVSNSSLACSSSSTTNSGSNASNSSSSNGGGSSTTNLEVNRKSPLISASNSPKSSIKQEKCEDGSDDEGSRPDTSSGGGGVGGGGPKVPPLKIVLSSCGGGSSNTSGASSQEQEQSGPQAGKNTGGRHLPYVVPATQADQGIKEETASSPADCKDVSHVDEPLSPGGSTGGEKSAPRITRSQRGTGSNSADEGSGTVKVEVKQEEHSAVTTTSGSAGGSSNVGNNSSSSNTNSIGASGSNNSSSSTTAVTASATTTTTTPTSSSNCGGGGSSESVHPRKRKLNIKEEEPEPSQPSQPEQPLTNCYQMFLKIRKQIDDRRKLLFPVQPKPPQGFKDYLMNRGTYVLAGNPSSQQSVPIMDPPTTLSQPLKDLFTEQERDRYKLRLQHQIEREKLVLSVEQEILREHGRAARALANQALPFSACTVLRDQEVYNILTPEQEEKHRNARSRYNGRLFISWLQDVDDKWEKIKESMVLRQQNEAESLNAVHRMDWEWKMKELGLCDNKSRPVIEDLHVPTVAVSDFDLLPA